MNWEKFGGGKLELSTGQTTLALVVYSEDNKLIYEIRDGTVETCDWPALAKLKDRYLAGDFKGTSMAQAGCIATALWKARNE